MLRVQGGQSDTDLERRRLLKMLGFGSMGLLAGGSGVLGGCSCGGGRKVQTIGLWGTGTLDVGDLWSALEPEYIKVLFEDNGNDPGPIITKLTVGGEASRRHISGLQGGAERELAMKGAIVPWDVSLIRNYEKLWPWAKEIGYTKVNGEVYGIPSVINADSMIYLPDRVGTVDSYAAVFDQQFRGRTSMEDAWINSVIFTAIYLKDSGEINISDPGNLTETELDDVMKFLEDMASRGQFRKLWNGWKDGVDLVVNEEVWVMTGWEPIVYAARSRGVNARYAIPKEGYEGWSNDLLIHPGAHGDGIYEAAHRLVDWELSGRYGCELASLRGYVVPTDSAIEYSELHPESYSPHEVKGIVENVKNKFFAMKGNVYWQNVRPDNYRLYEERWSKFRNMI